MLAALVDTSFLIFTNVVILLYLFIPRMMNVLPVMLPERGLYICIARNTEKEKVGNNCSFQ